MSTSTTDPRLAPFVDLRADRDRRDDPWMICEGQLCIRRAIENGFVVETLFTTEAQLAALPVPASTQVIVADNATLQNVTGFKFHRGCLATVLKRPLPAPSFDGCDTVLFAEAVSNPSNMGALIRNCRSFGVDLLVITPSCADPFSRRAVRTAMGNVFSLKIALTLDIAAAIRAFPGDTFAATLGPNARPLSEVKRPARLGVVVGTENTGLLPSTIAACRAEVTIPMAPDADSLNVAAASAVLLYALRKTP